MTTTTNEMTIEQIEGYIIALEDLLEDTKEQLEMYKEGLLFKRRFSK